MALNPSGAISLGGPVTGQSIAVELGLSPTASISLNGTDVRTLAQVPSGQITMPTNFWGKSIITGTQRAFIAWGNRGTNAPLNRYNVWNFITNTGEVGSDTSQAAYHRRSAASATYGGDKAIAGLGVITTPTGSVTSICYISNTGAVGGDVSTSGVTAGTGSRGTSYGTGQAVFLMGGRRPPAITGTSTTINRITDTGAFGSNEDVGGTARTSVFASTYGGDKAIFGLGGPVVPTNNTYRTISNTGVFSSDTPAAISPGGGAAASYGGDKSVWSRSPSTAGDPNSVVNYISNTGVISSDTTVNMGSPAPVMSISGAGYGGDKGFIGISTDIPTYPVAYINRISNTGVFSAQIPTVAFARSNTTAAGYSLT